MNRSLPAVVFSLLAAATAGSPAALHRLAAQSRSSPSGGRRLMEKIGDGVAVIQGTTETGNA